MTRTLAAIAAFFMTLLYAILFIHRIANAADDYREMYATSSTGAEFIITNQTCDINFGEPVPFKYHGYFVQDGVRYDACWYGNDAAIWFAVDQNSFRVRQNAQPFKGEY
jgi:hypothetical protein